MASGRRPSGAAPGSEDTWPPAPTRGTQGASRNGRGPAENPETGGPHRGGRPEHRSACWDIVRPEDKAHNKDRNVVASDPRGARAGQGKAAGGGGRVRLGPRCGSVQLQPSRFPRTPPGPGVGAGRGGHSPQAPGAPRHLGTLWVQWGQHRPAERGTGLLGPVSAPHGPPDPTYWPAASTPPCARALRGLPHERPSPGLSQPPASGQEASAALLPTTATPLRLHPAPGCHRGWGVGWEWAVPSGVRVWSNTGTPPPHSRVSCRQHDQAPCPICPAQTPGDWLHAVPRGRAPAGPGRAHVSASGATA